MKRLPIWLLLIFLAHGEAAELFNNPLLTPGADPSCMYYNGTYFYLMTDSLTNLYLRAASQIAGSNSLSTAPPIPVYSVQPPYNAGVEAPEIKNINGVWYLYYSAGTSGDANDTTHRMFCLRANTSNPRKSWAFMGKVADAAADFWAIDGNVIQKSDGSLYFVWCGRTSTTGKSRLYIAPMTNPWTVQTGSRVLISSPTFSWENGINEAPAFLYHNAKIFIIYSANCSCGNNYCLGQLVNTDGNLLNPASWVKNTTPIFQSYAGTDGAVYAPGSCTFTISPDGIENWMIYHTAQYPGSGFTRWIQAQKFTWNEDDSPNLGHPFPTSNALGAPSASLARPQIVNDVIPIASTQLQGSTIILQAMAAGQPPIAYQWKSAGTNLMDNGRIKGSQGNLLTISNCQVGDTGNYQLFATNSFGGTNFRATVIKILPPANVIYYQDFTTKGNVSIEGTLPDIATAFGGGVSASVWNNTSANSNALSANGTTPLAFNDANQQNSTLLPFTPQAGYVYRLTASLTLAANSGNFVGLGFSQFDPASVTGFSGRFNDAQINGYSWMLVRTTAGGVEQGFSGPATTGGANIFSADVIPTGTATTAALEIDLDTTGTSWVTTMYINGVQEGSPFVYASTPSISAVGLTMNEGIVSGGVVWNNVELQAENVSGAPKISQVTTSGGNMVFSGSGGVANGGFHVLSTTNLALPFLQWTAAGTGTFDGSGVLNVTNAINPATPESFYIIQVP